MACNPSGKMTTNAVPIRTPVPSVRNQRRKCDCKGMRRGILPSANEVDQRRRLTPRAAEKLITTREKERKKKAERDGD